MTNEERKAHKREQYSQQKARERKLGRERGALVHGVNVWLGPRPKTVYLSCPMSGKSQSEIDDTFTNARQWAKAYFRVLGMECELIDPSKFMPTPPGHTKRTWARLTPNQQWLAWMKYDLEVLSTCDIVVFGNGWSKSAGCRIEHETAQKLGKVTMYSSY